MSGRDEPSVAHYGSSSFAQVAPRSATATIRPTSTRPATQRSVSGSAHTGQITGNATMDSPAQTPGDEATPDPIIAMGQTTPAAHKSSQRSLTTSPAVFGLTKLDQSAWSDSSGPNTSSPSSVWNGRGAHNTDSDALGTATTSNVSTPGRITASDSAEFIGPSIKYNAPPLLSSEGPAWANARSSTAIWPNNLTKSSTNSVDSNPIAVRQPVQDRQRKTVVIGNNDSQSKQGRSEKRDRSAKKAPIRSTTLDPSQLPSGKAKSSAEEDPADAKPADDLTSDFNDLSLGNANQSAPIPLLDQPTVGQPDMRSPAVYGGDLGYVHRPSGSYTAINPRNGYVHPSPYMPNSDVRSPGGFAPPFDAGMNNAPPVDMSGYESYRTTPDPYAPTMPGRAIFTSPGSQGSGPQSPAFGPVTILPQYQGPMRGGEPVFYPGPPGTGNGGFMGPGPMMASSRPMMLPGAQHYPYGTGPSSDARSSPIGQSPMLPHGMPIASGNLMLGPVSPLLPHMSPITSDRHLSQSHGHGHQYMPGLHRRMGSNVENFVPLSPRPPYPMGPHQGGMMPGHMHMQGFPSGPPMQGPWNGRYPDHRSIPTGPGGVMAPPTSFGLPMDPRQGPAYYYNSNNNRPGMGTESAGSSRSPLLEDFRNRHAKNRKFELKDILGSVVEFSGDQHGSRFIQEKLDNASLEEKTAIFDEILPHARALMTDVFGNYVIQKIFEHGLDKQRSVLAKDMETHVLSLSLGTYGCRVVQKAFDHTSADQCIKLAKELDGHVLQCVRDQNANHVVQKVIERVSPLEVDFVPQAFRGQVPLLASHCYSCRVLQRIFEHCDESQSRPLLQELHADSVRLMQDQYGNYVIQWVLQRGQPQDRAQVIAKIKGSILQLSRHKFASNVIEEVIRSSNAQDRSDMIEEILTPVEVALDSPDASVTIPGQPIAPAVLMMRDQFANYVLQRFLEKADKEQRAKLVHLIHTHQNSAKKFTQGHPTKHLVAIERFIETLPEHADAFSSVDSGNEKAQPTGQVVSTS